jgi:hypothetical protein
MATKDVLAKDLPKLYNTSSNSVLGALLEAWGNSDDEILEQLANTKAQLFIKTASGVYLDRLASNLGVSRPAGLGLSDEAFSKLIPNLSLKNKQLSKSFYDTMDIFWGELYSRANIHGLNNAPFNVSVGDHFIVTLDGGEEKQVTVKTGDIEVNGAATAQEIIDILNQIEGLTASIITQLDGNERINIRTNTRGLRGSIKIDGTYNFSGVGFSTTGTAVTLNDLSQRTLIYSLNPNEVIIEIPAFVPIVGTSLKGSHHFHEDNTIESNNIWPGSFIYSRTENPFVPTSKTVELNQTILVGSQTNTLTVVSTAGLPASGKLVIDFGKNEQEYGLEYFSILNDQTIEIDAGYVFENRHTSGAILNVLAENENTPYLPKSDGSDYAVYLPSIVDARTIIQGLLSSLAAAGVVVTFVVLLPEYDYWITNPFE